MASNFYTKTMGIGTEAWTETAGIGSPFRILYCAGRDGGADDAALAAYNYLPALPALETDCLNPAVIH